MCAVLVVALGSLRRLCVCSPSSSIRQLKENVCGSSSSSSVRQLKENVCLVILVVAEGSLRGSAYKQP